jgi:uncharacterized protein
MKATLSRFGDWALVAGAAEGIGEAFSQSLAAAGMNLILCDIKADLLDQLADRLEHKNGIKTIRIYKDLADNDAAEYCFSNAQGIDFGLLVYVPAFSPVGRFSAHTTQDVDRFVALNISTPVRMVHAFLNRNRDNSRRGIILMSSLAGVIGPAFTAPYAGSKAFSILFAESLFHELKNDKIEILACCAGPTSTPTYWSSRPEGQSSMITVMDSLDVAQCALENLGRKPVCIPGLTNRITYFFLTRFLSRKMAGTVVDRSIKKMYPGL